MLSAMKNLPHFAGTWKLKAQKDIRHIEILGLEFALAADYGVGKWSPQSNQSAPDPFLKKGDIFTVRLHDNTDRDFETVFLPLAEDAHDLKFDSYEPMSSGN